MSFAQAVPLLSLLLAWWVVGRAAERAAASLGLARASVADLTTTVLALSVVTARLAAVAPTWRSIVAHPLDLLRIGSPGQLSFYGGVFGALVGLGVFGRRAGLPIPTVADLYGLVAPLGFAVYGGACLVRGDCYGRVAPPPFGIVFPGIELPRFPVELYGVALALVAYGGLLRLAARRPATGALAAAAVAAVATIQALLEPMRLDADAGLFDREQALAIGVGAAALVALQVRWLIQVRRGTRIERIATATNRSDG